MLDVLFAIDPKIFGILGIVLSAAIAAFGYYGKLRRERSRTKRTVLFYLLRLWHQVAIEDRMLRTLALTMPDAIEKSLQPYDLPITQDLKKNFFEKASRSLQKFLLAKANAATLIVVVDLERAIVDLARDDPLLAFQLSNSIPETQAVNAQADIEVDTVPSKIRYDEALSSSKTTIGRRFKLQSLTSNVRIVSIECGVFTWIAIEFTLWRFSKVDTSKPFAAYLSLMVDADVEQSVSEARSELEREPMAETNAATAQ